MSNDHPVPPESLRVRVSGHPDPAIFREIGETLSGKMLAAIKPRITLTAQSRVLDFGCGCGRVAIYFRQATGAELYGSDIDGEAIAWCSKYLADIGDFRQNASAPPLPFDAEFFDFVYAVSVFTHLPKRMETAWLAELRRVVKPGGYLALSTHAAHSMPGWPPKSFILASHEYVKALVRFALLYGTGFFYWKPGSTPGLPRFYGVSYHTDKGIRAQWGRFFEIVAIIPKGIADHQDLVLCRRSQSFIS